jgi:cytochrome c oxidase subunit II
MIWVSAALAAAPSSSVETAAVAQGQLIAVGGGPGGAGAACFSCHGLQGQGDADRAFPRLTGLNVHYLAKQLDDYASGTRSDVVWGGGVALPGLTLTALIPYVLSVGGQMRTPILPNHLTVDVTGHLYWWEMSYRRPDGLSAVTSANELRLPVGEPVEVFLRAADVIHSFWVPNLAGKTDMIPGRVTRMVIQADRPGVYRGQCAEYCGAQHALMAFDVIAIPRAEFDAWLAGLAHPAREPETPERHEGRELFVALGCGACHAVRGLTEGRLGPDLTQVGARRSLAAGTLKNGVGNLAGWIASAQHLKPGNRMPSYDQLHGPQLRALAAYLESLK